MKKILLFVLTSALVLSVCACGNKQDENKPTGSSSVSTTNNVSPERKELIYDSTEAFEYSDVEDGIIITHFSNYDNVEYDKIYVPSEIDGKKVIGIGSLEAQHRIFGAVFGECEVVIPNTVQYIASMAFSGAKGLVKLSGGENCTKIGEYAFMNCVNLSEITFIDSVTDLADNAFAGCTKWESTH